MKIHEYQAKQIFARYGVPIPRGIPVQTADEAEAAAKTLIDETKIPVVVVKAQIHAGGRGKGGGVKLAKNGPGAGEGHSPAQILGMQLVTKQTGAEGRRRCAQSALRRSRTCTTPAKAHQGVLS